MPKINYQNERKRISRLIYLVLAETIPVRKAILDFPKDSEDLSINAAYHALIHMEADEDFRKQDLDYKDEQNDYLEFIAQIFQKGDPLPENIIKSYEKYYQNISTPTSESMKGFLKNLCKFLNV